MKKAIIYLIVVLIAALFVTCGLIEQLEGENDDEVIGYSDVEYVDTPNGAQITVYIDGSTPVPVTKASKRAMTRDLAKMAYDYFEVIFVSGTGGTAGDTTAAYTSIARASWELGQSAGISGVDRGSNPTTGNMAGVNYAWSDTAVTLAKDTSPTVPARGLALMFVGKKDGRTLLGVGRIGDVDHAWANGGAVAYTVEGGSGATLGQGAAGGIGFPNTAMTALVTDSSKSVTFFIEPVRTGLLIKKEAAADIPGDSAPAAAPAGYTKNTLGILTDSFDFDTGNTDNTLLATWTRADHSARTPLGGSNYPMYSLPQAKDTSPVVANPIQHANFVFKGAANRFQRDIKFSSATTVAAGAFTALGVYVEKRFPRFMDGGRYGTVKSGIDTDTLVELDTNYGSHVAGSSFDPKIPLKFKTMGNGVFSFFIEVPVYMLLRTDKSTPAQEAATKPTNGGPEAEIWKIRTGIGSELYSLDTGKGAGGCVLMGVGVSSLDELEIEWSWIQ